MSAAARPVKKANGNNLRSEGYWIHFANFWWDCVDALFLDSSHFRKNHLFKNFTHFYLPIFLFIYGIIQQSFCFLEFAHVFVSRFGKQPESWVISTKKHSNQNHFN